MNIIKFIKSLDKKKNLQLFPINDILDAAKRSHLAYKTPDELEDIIDEVDVHNISDFIKRELDDTFVYYISDKTTDAQLYIWIKNEICYITFRGTSGFKDVVKDLKISSQKIKENTIKLKGIPSVHQGFYEQFISIYDEIVSILNKESANFNKIIISGHSLGGALAHLSVPFIYESFKKEIICYTFGSPRVGNKHFIEWFDKSVSLNYRISNKEDLITSIPIGYTWIHTMNQNIVLDNSSNITINKHDTIWYKRLFISIKLINIKDPKKDHSCKYYIDRLENLSNKN